MSPIFHLSFPVTDLEEALDFYIARFGATPGRREQDWADIAMFGAQVTLQRAPSDVTQSMPRTRHFGVTLAWPDWQQITGQFVEFVEAPTISHHGSELEQAKAMVSDPSGNLIEMKAYRDPGAVLRGLHTAAP